MFKPTSTLTFGEDKLGHRVHLSLHKIILLEGAMHACYYCGEYVPLILKATVHSALYGRLEHTNHI